MKKKQLFSTLKLVSAHIWLFKSLLCYFWLPGHGTQLFWAFTAWKKTFSSSKRPFLASKMKENQLLSTLKLVSAHIWLVKSVLCHFWLSGHRTQVFWAFTAWKKVFSSSKQAVFSLQNEEKSTFSAKNGLLELENVHFSCCKGLE